MKRLTKSRNTYALILFICFLINFPIQGQIIVIDAGHGFNSDGTNGDGRTSTEINTNWAVSIKLQTLLQNNTSWTVHLTRPNNGSGSQVTINDRWLMSNNWNADIFLSIHCNAGGGTGTETFYCNNNDPTPSPDLSLATEVQARMVQNGAWRDRRVVEDNSYLGYHLGVLNYSTATACLNEIGFVDYASDATKLLNNTWRDNFATAYYNAFQNHLGISDNPPAISSFSISSGTITLGNSFTLSYSVTDDFGLSRVELWRTTDINNWGNQSLKTTTLSGQKSYSGSFTDTPSSQGSYWYGLHVVDTKGQAKYEPDPPGPLKGIVSSATLTVTYPNTNVTLFKGTSYTITWNSSNVSGNIQIDLYKGGTNVLQLAAGAQNTGSYPFNPPSNLVDGSDYKIGISAMSGSVSDKSDNNFNISSPSVQYSLIVNSNNGTVTKSPNQSSYTSGTAILLTATPNSGYTFSGWSVSSGGSFTNTSSTTTTFTITGNANITASFIANPNPAITVSQYSLSFSNQQINTTSSSQYYTVSGSNLTSNITITPPTGFQISQDNITWQTTPITLYQSSGAVQNTSIYVRFAPTSATSYSGNISNASNGATTQNVSVSGTGIPPSTSASIKPVPPAGVNPGAEFWVEIKVGDPNAVTNLFGASFILNYNTTYLDYVSSESMSWFGTDLVFLPNNDELAGKTSIGISRKNPASGISGSGVIARIKYVLNLSVPNNTILDFTLTDVTATDNNNATIILNPIATSSNVISGISVWSGDTNNDGKVDQADVLPLGIHWNRTGAARQNTSTQWIAQSCTPWSPQTATYADANGSGKVDQGDVLPIGQNWGKTHTINKIAIVPREEINQGYKVSLDQGNDVIEKNEYVVNIRYEQTDRLSHALRGLSFVIKYDASAEKIDIERGEYFGKEVIDIANDDESRREMGYGIARVETNSQINDQGTVLKLRIKAKEKDGEIKIEDIEGVDVLGNKVVIESSTLKVKIVELKAEEIASDYRLEQNYPNPFNPTTTIEYLLKKDGYIRLGIFNALGQEVMVLREGYISAGRYKAIFDGKDFPSGNYFYKLKINADLITRKMTLIK